MTSDEVLVQAILDSAHALHGADSALDPLVELCSRAHVVLIGEASHGTHEFYRWRAQLTKRLIAEKGFAAVTAEADWPDRLRTPLPPDRVGTVPAAPARPG